MKDIVACPICGSQELSGLKHMENWMKKTPMSSYTCQKCGNLVIPFILDSEEDYKKFLIELEKKDQE